MPARFDRGVGPQFTRAYTSSKEDLMAEPFGTRIYFTASSSALARDGMALKPDRWRLENYHRSGGPVLWAHKHDMPAIGNGVGKVESRLRVGVEFDQEDPFARSVESKVRRKFIRGSSVGWDFVSSTGEVIRNSRAFASTLAKDAWYDLSELSIVNVPSDPLAVSERSWRALSAVSPKFADMFEMQERWDSDVTAPELRRALIGYCTQLGLDLRYLRGAEPDTDEDEDESDDSDNVVSADSEDDEDGGGGSEDVGLVDGGDLRDSIHSTWTRPRRSHALPTAPAVSMVDARAARSILDAFGTLVR